MRWKRTSGEGVRGGHQGNGHGCRSARPQPRFLVPLTDLEHAADEGRTRALEDVGILEAKVLTLVEQEVRLVGNGLLSGVDRLRGRLRLSLHLGSFRCCRIRLRLIGARWGRLSIR